MSKVAHTIVQKNPHAVYGFSFQVTITEEIGNGFRWSVYFLSHRAKYMSMPPYIHNDDVLHSSLNECIFDACDCLAKQNYFKDNKQVLKALRIEHNRITEPVQLSFF